MRSYTLYSLQKIILFYKYTCLNFADTYNNSSAIHASNEVLQSAYYDLSDVNSHSILNVFFYMKTFYLSN